MQKPVLLSKIRASMKTLVHSLLLPLIALALTGPARGERADRDKPMNIEADGLRYDDQKQSSVFTGRVVLTKGTIVIRGAQLTVRQDPDGSQFGVVVAEPGQLAFFRQKREGLDEFMEGEAETIEYDGRADTVKFNRKAQLRRFKGAALYDESSGGVIQYDNNSNVYTVDGELAKSNSGAAGGRIRVMLTPKQPASAPAAAQGGASAAVPALRPSTTLGGERK